MCPELRRLNLRALGEFVACGCTLEERSLFEEIHILPGGSRWFFRNGSLAGEEKYFRPEEWENQNHLEPEPYYEEIRHVFSRNLPRFFEGRERIGMSLTGGLDTRIVMAWQKSQPTSLPCYTFGGMLRDCQDVIVAREIARICGQTHAVIPAGREFLAGFPHHAERAVYLSDGCVDVSHAPDVHLNNRAREIAPIRMTGLYGGEILRRVRSFKAEKPPPELFAPSSSATSARPLRHTLASFKMGTQFPLPSSSRPHGINTGRWRSSRHRFLFDPHFWTTTLSAPCIARRSRPSRATRFPSG